MSFSEELLIQSNFKCEILNYMNELIALGTANG